MFLILIIIVLYLFLNRDRDVSTYTNYIEYKKPFLNCSEVYEKRLIDLQNYSRTIQPFGYARTEYLDKTRFIKSDEPLPTNPDFFM
tara:strand:- start:459 stop:716 length:258 start_codon:yes stop_codon:yes gene_type:complete